MAEAWEAFGEGFLKDMAPKWVLQDEEASVKG